MVVCSMLTWVNQFSEILEKRGCMLTMGNWPLEVRMNQPGKKFRGHGHDLKTIHYNRDIL